MQHARFKLHAEERTCYYILIVAPHAEERTCYYILIVAPHRSVLL
jgi:hypothetical protein